MILCNGKSIDIGMGFFVVYAFDWGPPRVGWCSRFPGRRKWRCPRAPKLTRAGARRRKRFGVRSIRSNCRKTTPTAGGGTGPGLGRRPPADQYGRQAKPLLTHCDLVDPIPANSLIRVTALHEFVVEIVQHKSSGAAPFDFHWSFPNLRAYFRIFFRVWLEIGITDRDRENCDEAGFVSQFDCFYTLT